ncbi:hypothetical protein Fcan01_24380 [Folsomia candida]|uniref:Uncharacterized protein n=1 Tax=Folsomia candida TaxID=158441 RepID=A0A226D8I3_FOLCA|nr:hypothetical protein Fcan01_24380 [Folsomia candida]
MKISYVYRTLTQQKVALTTARSNPVLWYDKSENLWSPLRRDSKGMVLPVSPRLWGMLINIEIGYVVEIFDYGVVSTAPPLLNAYLSLWSCTLLETYQYSSAWPEPGLIRGGSPKLLGAAGPHHPGATTPTTTPLTTEQTTTMSATIPSSEQTTTISLITMFSETTPMSPGTSPISPVHEVSDEIYSSHSSLKT